MSRARTPWIRSFYPLPRADSRPGYENLALGDRVGADAVEVWCLPADLCKGYVQVGDGLRRTGARLLFKRPNS